MDKRRILVEIKSDHSAARLTLDGYEFEIPLASWSVNGGLGLSIPWEWVDLKLQHPDSAPFHSASNDRDHLWSGPAVTPVETIIPLE